MEVTLNILKGCHHHGYHSQRQRYIAYVDCCLRFCGRSPRSVENLHRFHHSWKRLYPRKSPKCTLGVWHQLGVLDRGESNHWRCAPNRRNGSRTGRRCQIAPNWQALFFVDFVPFVVPSTTRAQFLVTTSQSRSDLKKFTPKTLCEFVAKSIPADLIRMAPLCIPYWNLTLLPQPPKLRNH